MKNVPIDYIEAKHLTPDLRKKINGGEQTINNYTTNVSNTYINGVVKAKCISINNISLTDTTTIIDDYTLLTNDIILVAGQTDKLENGLYRYDTNFVRYDFEAGDLIAILNGTDYANSLWKNTNNEIVIGTTGIEFEQINVINYLSDVNIDTPANNEVLTYKDGEWVNLEVTSLPSGTENQTLRHNGTDWVANDYLKLDDSSDAVAMFETSGANYLKIKGNDKKIMLYDGANYFHISQLNNGNLRFGYNTQDVMFISANKAHISNLNMYQKTAKTLVYLDGSKDLQSISDGTSGQFLKTNGAGTYSFASPNLIKYNTALISDTLGVWTNIPTLTFSLEANVTYELELYLSLGNNAGRNGSIRIDTTSASYTHRPFIIGNSNGANPAVIYINDSTATQPFNLDNSTELQVQNADSGSIVMLKGIITSSINIPSATIQIKTRDIGSAFQCKEYSYLKLSR